MIDNEFKSLKNILIDEHKWKPIFLGIDKVFEIRWEIEPVSNQFIGPFFKPHDNVLELFADSNLKCGAAFPLPMTQKVHQFR